MRDLNAYRGEFIRLSDAARLKCLDCCCNQKTEVRDCPAIECPLWQYRLGKATPLSPEQKEKVVQFYERVSKTGRK